MKRDAPEPNEGLLANRKDRPDLRELTLSLGRSDIYVNLDKHVDTPDGHMLFEAILTDDNGSRVIFLDREDLAECIKESFVLGGQKP